MKKRTLTAILMTAVLTIGMCMPALAAEQTGDGSADLSSTLEINYTASPSYTVSIPATVTASKDAATEVQVTLADCLLAEGKVLQVTPSGDFADGKVTLKCNSTTVDVPFALKAGSSNELVTTTSSCIYELGKLSDVTFNYAGDYKGTVTFTIVYTNATP